METKIASEYHFYVISHNMQNSLLRLSRNLCAILGYYLSQCFYLCVSVI